MFLVPRCCHFYKFSGKSAVEREKVELSFLQFFMVFWFASQGRGLPEELKNVKTTSGNPLVFKMEQKRLPKQFLMLFTYFWVYSDTTNRPFGSLVCNFVSKDSFLGTSNQQVLVKRFRGTTKEQLR